METALIAGSAALSGLAGLLVSGRSLPPLAGTDRSLPAVWLRAASALRRMGGWRVVSTLGDLRPVRSLADGLAHRLGRLGLELDAPSTTPALLLAMLLLSLLGGVLFATPLAALVVALGLVGLMLAGESSLRRRERQELLASMPGVYRTLSVALGSGQTLSQAVAYVGAHEHGEVARVFARMSLRLRCGASTEEAVDLLARELAAPGAELLATALVISHRTGSPLRDLLLRSAALAERQQEFERTLGVKTAQVRLSVRIVCLLPVVMMGLLALLSPDFQAGLLTPAGMGCVMVAALLDAVALLVIRRLMKGVI